jgi:predicted MFS family arabinose efflux permease
VQAVSYLAVALLAVTQRLPFWLLLLLIGINGCATVFFQIASTSYLPALLADPRSLQRGNIRLQLSESLSRSLGPALAGPLIAATGVASAVLAAGTFVVSVLTLLGIRHREQRPAPPGIQRGWLVRDVRAGLAFVAHHRLLEPVLSCGTVYVLVQSMVMAILVLYCGQVQLRAAAIGLVVGAAALGYPIGNLARGRLTDRLGAPRTLVMGAVVSVLGIVLIPVAGG